VSYAKKAQPAQSLLLDAGACFAGYCSDITRTWVKGGGSAADAFGRLLAGMEAMQQRLCAAVRTGMPYEELHDRSHREMAQVLRDAGISRLSTDELVARGVTRAFYPHGLGHSLGLQCHDVGCALRPPRADNPYLRNTTEIAEGQVFTIEPGLYFIDALLAPLRSSPDIDWKLVDALARLGGIRIEDDVVVQAEGIRNLTREVLPEGGGAA
jgi:Xaa-Pro dipeptidase